MLHTNPWIKDTYKRTRRGCACIVLEYNYCATDLSDKLDLLYVNTTIYSNTNTSKYYICHTNNCKPICICVVWLPPMIQIQFQSCVFASKYKQELVLLQAITSKSKFDLQSGKQKQVWLAVWQINTSKNLSPCKKIQVIVQQLLAGPYWWSALIVRIRIQIRK